MTSTTNIVLDGDQASRLHKVADVMGAESLQAAIMALCSGFARQSDILVVSDDGTIERRYCTGEETSLSHGDR